MCVYKGKKLLLRDVKIAKEGLENLAKLKKIEKVAFC